jgi:hypothetical protein
MTDDPFSLPVPPREEAQSTAFEFPTEPQEVGGIVMRPFSSFSWDRCQRFGIKIALEKFEDIKKLPTTQILREVAFVAWMQSTDPREVSKAFQGSDADVWVEVEMFEADFNSKPEANRRWMEIVGEVTTVILTSEALLFQLSETEEAKKLKSEGETPPGNS